MRLWLGVFSGARELIATAVLYDSVRYVWRLILDGDGRRRDDEACYLEYIDRFLGKKCA